jgi:hypothetical protein
VNEAVIQPSVERVLDPEFQASVKGYASEATKKAAQVGSVANEFVLSWCPSLRLIILMLPSGGGRPPWVLMLLAKLPVSLVSLVARWGGAAAPTPAMARSLNSTTLRTTIPRTMTKTKTTFSTTSSHRAVTSIPVQAQWPRLTPPPLLVQRRRMNGEMSGRISDQQTCIPIHTPYGSRYIPLLCTCHWHYSASINWTMPRRNLITCSWQLGPLPRGSTSKLSAHHRLSKNQRYHSESCLRSATWRWFS